MPRPRKPTRILELNGSFRKNPNRRRLGEPIETRPLGDPPERLPAEVLPFWNELTVMVPEGVLTISDRWAVEEAAHMMFKSSQGTAKGYELRFLQRMLSCFGLTPADRSKLSVPVVKKVNPFAQFRKEME